MTEHEVNEFISTQKLETHLLLD